MRIEINLPDRLWGEVLNVAEANATTVARVVEAAVRDAMRPNEMGKLEQRARRNHVLQAWAQGLTDAAIAERTGELRNYVAATRRAAGFPPNRVGANRKDVA